MAPAPGWIDEVSDELRIEARLARAAEEVGGFGTRSQPSARGAASCRGNQLGGDLGQWVSVSSSSAWSGPVSRRADRAADHDAARVEREVRAERRAPAARLRVLAGVLAAGTLVSAGLAITAGLNETSRGYAALARVRELASAAVAATGTDPERAVLLALEALDESRAGGDTVRRRRSSRPP